jgi:hypothetical protein
VGQTVYGGVDDHSVGENTPLYSMNPNFLLKDELLYQWDIRGISSDADVQTLRRLFRSVVSQDLPVDVSKVGSLGVEQL